MNYLGNLQLLEAVPNIEKQDIDFDLWLNKIYPNPKDKKAYMQRHYIPDIELSFPNFIDFIEEREGMLKEKFKEVLQA